MSGERKREGRGDDRATPTERLEALGISLAPPVPPVADYLGAKVSGRRVWVSGHASDLRGEAGSEVGVLEARQAARRTAIALLGTLSGAVGGLDRVRSIDKLTGFVRSAPTFTDQPLVVDGASELLAEVFGDAGRHARSAIGVTQLPMGVTVELELMLTLDEEVER